MKEIVTYFLNRGSQVYSCFLDAKKLFERILHDNLFSLLIDRKIPSIIVRSLLDILPDIWCAYPDKEAFQKTVVFVMVSGKKKFISITYTVYLDELLKGLRNGN